LVGTACMGDIESGSVMIMAAPPRARFSKYAICSSATEPLRTVSVVIEACTMRLRKVLPASLMGENKSEEVDGVINGFLDLYVLTGVYATNIFELRKLAQAVI